MCVCVCMYVCISINPFYWAFKTEGKANTPTAVLKEARVLVSDANEHFKWETRHYLSES